jgi:hypothetical protein
MGVFYPEIKGKYPVSLHLKQIKLIPLWKKHVVYVACCAVGVCAADHNQDNFLKSE